MFTSEAHEKACEKLLTNWQVACDKRKQIITWKLFCKNCAASDTSHGQQETITKTAIIIKQETAKRQTTNW